ncbi:hypothetical protein ACOSQ4_027713 [Xanthoceras sorbifolium]
MASSSTLVSLESCFPLPLLLLITPLVLLILKHKFSKYPPLPPGPKPWPIIGNLPLMGNNPHVTLAQVAKAYGPLISLHLGTQLVIVGSSPAAATAILRTHDRELSGRKVPFALFLREPKLNRVPLAWTFKCNEEWKSFRTLMKSELFTSKKIDNQSIIREKKVHEMVEYLASKEGETVEIREVAFVNIFNSLANTYCSKDFDSFDEGSGESSSSTRSRASRLVRDMLELWAAPNISDMFPVLSVFDLQRLRRKSDKCVEKMREIWDSTIRERRERKVGGELVDDDICRDTDFLDVLLDSGFSDELISYIFVPPSPTRPKTMAHHRQPIVDRLGDKPHVVFAQLAKSHGPLFSLRLGTQLVIVGSSPAAATTILKTHDGELTGRHVPFV